MSSLKPNMQIVQQIQEILKSKGMYNQKNIEELSNINKSELKKTSALLFVKRSTLKKKIAALDYLLEKQVP